MPTNFAEFPRSKISFYFLQLNAVVMPPQLVYGKGSPLKSKYFVVDLFRKSECATKYSNLVKKAKGNFLISYIKSEFFNSYSDCSFHFFFPYKYEFSLTVADGYRKTQYRGKNLF